MRFEKYIIYDDLRKDVYRKMRNSRLNEDFVGEGGRLVDCPTQLTLMTWICQLCFSCVRNMK